MSKLFSTFKLRDTVFRNRVFVSPMCQYSSVEGVPDDWHFVHLGSRAVGGAGLVMVEATAIAPDGRISPADTGIWNTTQMKAFQRICRFMESQGARTGIQLAHAGRKASTAAPWDGGGTVGPHAGGWIPVAPSALPFDAGAPMPLEMTREDIQATVGRFEDAARRSLIAGFEIVEIHMAHGYLLHEFLSPLSNHRTDEYGGELANRMRFALEVARAVRAVWPAHRPVFARISATDWTEGGWDLPQSITLAHALRDIGIDLIDCSSGGNVPHAKIPVEPGYQVQFAEAIRREAKIATGAVGLITSARQAEEIVSDGKADAVFLARELLRDPYWPLRAAHALRARVKWPRQYERAKPADVE